uniref:Virion structural protein n=1 Tax=Pseudomonas phage RVTF4 TaxID=3236931 RepID=A0AB39CD84_9VIRU
MKVRDASGRLLDPGVDYTTVYHYADVSKLTGKEVMGFVVVKNNAVQSPVRVTYQALGGPFSINADELRELLDAIDETKFPFKWGDIIGKPTAFKPSPHTHEYWQLYGLDTTVIEIYRLAKAWEYGNKAVMNENHSYADSYIQLARDEINKYQAAVNAHLRDFQNPHRLTTLQVQREKLNNWGFSGVFHIADKTNNNTYLPIGGVFQIMNTELLPKMDAHIKNFNNPHQNTADQVGVWTKGYVDNERAKKLLWTEPSYNSTNFGGISESIYSNAARTAIPASEIISGRFPQYQVGTGWDGSDPTSWLLAGDKTWKHWSTFLKPINDARGKVASIGVVGSAAQGLGILNSAFADLTRWPSGSQAIAQWHHAPYGTHQYDVLVYARENGNWVYKATTQ